MKISKKDVIFNLLNFAGWLDNKDNINSDWFRCVAGALYIECLFQEECLISGKQVYKNLDGFSKVTNEVTCREWFEKTYDPHHPLRFSIETLDSIEEVRLFLKEQNTPLVNLLEIDSFNSRTYRIKLN